jgi:hypothetical protein
MDLLTTYTHDLRLGSANNYIVIVDLHTLQITRAGAKSSQSAFTSLFFATDFNNGDSLASVVTPLPAG